jgi:hypothetical protein
VVQYIKIIGKGALFTGKGLHMKRFKKFFAVAALLLSMLTTSVVAQSIVGAQETVQAATIKLNYSNLSLSEGQSRQLKISGTKASTKWSSSKSSVVKVTQKGKITALKEGSATITAKVGRKKLKCSVTVKNNFKANEAKKNIEKTEKIVGDTLYVFVKSNYNVPTDVSAKCTFYSAKGSAVDYSNDSVSFLEKGHTAILEFDLPNAKYETYEIEYKYSEGMEYFYHRSIIDFLSLSTEYIEDEYNPYIMATVKNTATYDCYYADIVTIFYDSNNEIIAIEDDVISVDAKSKDTVKISIPYDSSTYEDISYDHYDSFISYAYHLGK